LTKNDERIKIQSFLKFLDLNILNTIIMKNSINKIALAVGVVAGCGCVSVGRVNSGESNSQKACSEIVAETAPRLKAVVDEHKAEQDRSMVGLAPEQRAVFVFGCEENREIADVEDLKDSVDIQLKYADKLAAAEYARQCGQQGLEWITGAYLSKGYTFRGHLRVESKTCLDSKGDLSGVICMGNQLYGGFYCGPEDVVRLSVPSP
jgi:hypothetical protein